jgi:hypothetical protein
MPSAPSAKHLRESCFEILGKVVYGSSFCWVLDFGLLAFREEPLPNEYSVGDCIAGNINLGIDPFFYFERLCKVERVPPLIYDWEIDQICSRTAPLISDAARSALVPDKTRERVERVQKTDAWGETKTPRSYLEYTMLCRLIAGPRLPRRPGSSP